MRGKCEKLASFHSRVRALSFHFLHSTVQFCWTHQSYLHYGMCLMATTLEQLTHWINAPRETEKLEFKEAKTQYDNTKLFRHCVALANEGGGKLILGVTDAPPRKVIGSNAFRPAPGIQSRIFDKLGFRVEVEEFDHADGRVLIFHIPSRPRGTAYELDGAYWMRSTSGTVPMSEDQLRHIFDEGKPDWFSRPAVENCSDADVIQL